MNLSRIDRGSTLGATGTTLISSDRLRLEAARRTRGRIGNALCMYEVSSISEPREKYRGKESSARGGFSRISILSTVMIFIADIRIRPL